MDQAQRLRQLIEKKRQVDRESNKRQVDRESNKRFKVIAVSSGKGGVGKTSFVVNLAYSLVLRGLKVCVLDADFGMANVDIMYGSPARNSIYDVIDGDKSLREVIVETEYGVKLISGGTGLKKILAIDNESRYKLFNELEYLNDIDILIIDTCAGASDNVLKFIEVADEVNSGY